MAILLIFVCFASPYEVAFEHDTHDIHYLRRGADLMFWLNRVVDCFFVGDMVIQFMSAFTIVHRYGTTVVNSRRVIAKRYIKSWFFIDFISILPFDVIAIVVESQEVSQLQFLRGVRLLRLLKLTRLLRGLRIFRRYSVEMGFSYRRMTLWKLVGMVAVSAHWMSCMLGLVSRLQGEICHGSNSSTDCVETWLSEAATSIVTENGNELSPFHMYIVALYTTSTIIVHPHVYEPTDFWERVSFIVMVFTGGFIWTRVISRSTAIMTSLDRHTIAYHQNMDDLNAISHELHLSQDLKRNLRAYFMEARRTSHKATWLELQVKMSPTLRTEVAYQLHKTWMRRIPYFKGLSKFLVSQFSRCLDSLVVAAHETFGSNFTLYILHQGLVGRFSGKRSGKLCVLHPGAVWGEEHLLLTAWWLIVPNTATAITYAELLTLEREAFEKVCFDYPDCQALMRKHYVRYAVFRGIIHVAKRRRREELGEPESPTGVPAQDPNRFTISNSEAMDEEQRERAAQAERELEQRLKAKLSLAASRSPSLSSANNGGGGSLRRSSTMFTGGPELVQQVTKRLDLLETRQSTLEERTTEIGESTRRIESMLKEVLLECAGKGRPYKATPPTPPHSLPQALFDDTAMTSIPAEPS